MRRLSIGGVGAEWLRPVDADPSGTMLYLHGGGYVIGSARACRPLTSALVTATGAEVVALDYRLAPEAPFPAARDDALGAYRALLSAGSHPDRITLAGDSAGGGLALAAALAIREADMPLPGSLVLFSPWLDLTLSGESMLTRADVDPALTPESLRRWARLYLDGRQPSDPGCSPLLSDAAELAALPPMLVQVGTDEILLSDSERLAEAAPGVVTLQRFPGLWHDFQLYAGVLRVAQEALDRISTFLRGVQASSGGQRVVAVEDAAADPH